MNAGPPKICSATGQLASDIASDAMNLVELMSDLIGAGSDDANALAAARLLAARIGAMADAIAAAHGGSVWAGSMEKWLLPSGDAVDAWHALRAGVDHAVVESGRQA